MAAIGDAKAQLQQESATLDFHTLTAPYDAMAANLLAFVPSLGTREILTFGSGASCEA